MLIKIQKLKQKMLFLIKKFIIRILFTVKLIHHKLNLIKIMVNLTINKHRTSMKLEVKTKK
jgi:hypothetical protein